MNNLIFPLILIGNLLTPEQHDCAVDRLVEWMKSPDKAATIASATNAISVAAQVCGVSISDILNDMPSAEDIAKAARAQGM